MNQKKVGTDEAVQYVLDTGSESELSDLRKVTLRKILILLFRYFLIFVKLKKK